MTLLVLALAFDRSVLPLKALFDVLSVGATMGVLVLVWQHRLRVQAAYQGIPQTGAVIDFVPC